MWDPRAEFVVPMLPFPLCGALSVGTDTFQTLYPPPIAKAYQDVERGQHHRLEHHEALLGLGWSIVDYLWAVLRSEYVEFRAEEGPINSVEKCLARIRAKRNLSWGDDSDLLTTCWEALAGKTLLAIPPGQNKNRKAIASFIRAWKTIKEVWKADRARIADLDYNAALLRPFEVAPNPGDTNLKNFFSEFIHARNVRAHWNKFRLIPGEEPFQVKLNDHYYRTINPLLRAALEELLLELQGPLTTLRWSRVEDLHQDSAGNWVARFRATWGVGTTRYPQIVTTEPLHGNGEHWLLGPENEPVLRIVDADLPDSLGPPAPPSDFGVVDPDPDVPTPPNGGNHGPTPAAVVPMAFNQIPIGAELRCDEIGRRWRVSERLASQGSCACAYLLTAGSADASGSALLKAYDPAHHELMLREADWLEELSRQPAFPRRVHRNVAALVVHEGAASSLPSLVMEFIPQRDLRTVLAKDTAPTSNQGLLFLDHLVGVVAELHDSGLVHLDLKPANVLPAEEIWATRPRLIDVNSMQRIGGPASPPRTTGLVRPAELLVERRKWPNGPRRPRPEFDVYAVGVIGLLVLTWTATEEITGQDLEELGKSGLPHRFELLLGDVGSHYGRRVEQVLRWALLLQVADGSALRTLWDQARQVLWLPGAEEARGERSRDVYSVLQSLSASSENSIVAEGGRTLLQELSHCQTQLEDLLIENGTKRLVDGPGEKLPDLVILSGHAGDGKSHLIKRLETALEGVDSGPRRLLPLYDATHAPTKDKLSVEVLETFFSSFREGRTQKSPKDLRIVALNTGIAYGFFRDPKRTEKFKSLRSALRYQLGFQEKDDLTDRLRVWVVDLDLQRLVRSPDSAEPRLFDFMMDRLDPRDPSNLFDEELPCERCEARRMCPVRLNLWFLRQEPVRETLNTLLYAVWLEGRVHLTPRNLWDFLSRILVGRRIGSCWTTFADREQGERKSEYLDNLLPNLLFAPDQNPIFAELSRYDPTLDPTIEMTLESVSYQRGDLQPLDSTNLENQRNEGLRAWAGETGVHDYLLNAEEDNEALNRRRFDTFLRFRFLASGFRPEAFPEILSSAIEFDRQVLEPFMDGQADADGPVLDRTALLEPAERCLLQLFGKTVGNRKYLQRDLVVGETQAKLYTPFQVVRFARTPLPDNDRARVLPDLRRPLGYSTRKVRWQIVDGPVLTVDLEMYRLIRKAERGYKPTRKDLERFTALRFLEGQIVSSVEPSTLVEIDGQLFEFTSSHNDTYGVFKRIEVGQ